MLKIYIADFKNDLKIINSEKDKSWRFFYYGFAIVSICYYGSILNMQDVLLSYFETFLILGLVVLFIYIKMFDYFWDAQKPLSAKCLENLRKKLSGPTLDLIFTLYIDVNTSRSLTESDIKELSWSYESLDEALLKKMKSDEQAVIFGQEQLKIFEYHVSSGKFVIKVIIEL